MAQVLFKFGSRDEYEAVVNDNEIQDNALYFLLDSQELYRGLVPIGQAHLYEDDYEDGESFDEAILRVVGSSPAVPGDILILHYNNNTADFCIYVADHTWRKITATGSGGGGGGGAATNVDNKTIQITGGELALKNFGQKYYHYIPADVQLGINAHYVLQTVDAQHPWQAGLEPRVALENGVLVLGWYEPNPDTTSGLAARITLLEETTDEIIDDIDNHTEQLRTIRELLNHLHGVFQFKGSKDTLQELNAVQNPEVGDVYQVGDKEYAWDGDEWVQLGFNFDFTPIINRLEVIEEAIGIDEYTVLPNDNILERLDALEEALVRQIQVDDMLFVPVDGTIMLPVFSGTGMGFVPARDPNADQSYFLNAAGQWAIPRDDRIGNLTYGGQQYSTVENYVTAVVQNIDGEFSLEWQELHPEE